nr:reverse transcriptase domain-containing protein [Tanacetum cinerariifolium]
MFGLLKELTTSKAPEKVLIREETKSHVIKNVNSISLVGKEEEENNKHNVAIGNSDNETNGTNIEVPVKEAEIKNKAKKGVKNKPTKKAKNDKVVEASSSQPVEYYLKHRINEKLIEGLVNNPRPAETDIRLSLASHSYIYPLGIAEDVLVEVSKHVYAVNFMILDIKEDEKRPFILGVPFLTTAEVMIKFNKGTITLRSEKSKISFHRIPEPLCKTKRGVKNDIEPIALTMTVNRLILQWEERIRLHKEKKMEFDQWRSKNFKNEHPAPTKVDKKVEDQGEVT